MNTACCVFLHQPVPRLDVAGVPPEPSPSPPDLSPLTTSRQQPTNDVDTHQNNTN